LTSKRVLPGDSCLRSGSVLSYLIIPRNNWQDSISCGCI